MWTAVRRAKPQGDVVGVTDEPNEAMVEDPLCALRVHPRMVPLAGRVGKAETGMICDENSTGRDRMSRHTARLCASPQTLAE